MPKSPIPAAGEAVPAACMLVRLYLAIVLLRVGRRSVEAGRHIIDRAEGDRHDR
jgi:hypothetical protein